MDLDVRAMLTDTIRRFLEKYCRENEIESVWGDPIVGFGDARSPMFEELKQIVHPDHYTPEEVLPGARTVVSYYIPFSREVAKSAISSGTVSPEFAYACVLTNDIIGGLADAVETDLRAMDAEAVMPANICRLEGDIVSRWSQRHVARICGLGTYGLNNMLITEGGCCGRFYSVVTTLEVEPDPLPAEERCLYKRDGSCGVCMRRCRIHAINPGGFDRWACDKDPDRSRETYQVFACAKCIVGLPCSFRDPSKAGTTEDGVATWRA